MSLSIQQHLVNEDTSDNESVLGFSSNLDSDINTKYKHDWILQIANTDKNNVVNMDTADIKLIMIISYKTINIQREFYEYHQNIQSRLNIS